MLFPTGSVGPPMWHVPTDLFQVVSTQSTHMTSPPPFKAQDPSGRLCVLSTGSINKPHGKRLCLLISSCLFSGVLASGGESIQNWLISLKWFLRLLLGSHWGLFGANPFQLIRYLSFLCCIFQSMMFSTSHSSSLLTSTRLGFGCCCSIIESGPCLCITEKGKPRWKPSWRYCRQFHFVHRHWCI